MDPTYGLYFKKPSAEEEGRILEGLLLREKTKNERSEDLS